MLISCTLTIQRCRPRIAGGNSSGRLTSILLCALVAVRAMGQTTITAGTTNDDWKYCSNEVCDTVARLYELQVTHRYGASFRDPCIDFYTYACAGWFSELGRSRLGQMGQGAEVDVGVKERISDASDIILAQLLHQLDRRSLANNTVGKIRASELQLLYFYRSCMLSLTNSDWELNTRTLRKFFYRVGLPFFNQERASEQFNGGRTTVLGTLLKLALQFAMYPIFKTSIERTYLLLIKFQDSGPDVKESPRDLAEWYKEKLLNRSQNTENDAYILKNHGSLLDAYRLNYNESTLLTIGRNYEAVIWMYGRYFTESKRQIEDFNFGTVSDITNISYYELFNEHIGNVATLKENYILKMSPQFFLPMAILTTDPDLSQIFDDYIRLWILREEVSEIALRAVCAVNHRRRYCKFEQDWQRGELCGLMVSRHPLPD